MLNVLLRNEARAAEDANNVNKLTPLQLALYYGRKDAARLLIDKLGHSRVSTLDSRRRTNIHYAALGMPFTLLFSSLL